MARQLLLIATVCAVVAGSLAATGYPGDLGVRASLPLHALAKAATPRLSVAPAFLRAPLTLPPRADHAVRPAMDLQLGAVQ